MWVTVIVVRPPRAEAVRAALVQAGILCRVQPDGEYAALQVPQAELADAICVLGAGRAM